jgi:hypothetical protein
MDLAFWQCFSLNNGYAGLYRLTPAVERKKAPEAERRVRREFLVGASASDWLPALPLTSHKITMKLEYGFELLPS